MMHATPNAAVSGGSAVGSGARFTGPVFVVGMPRSGTKLFRDLLRGHSRIRIPPTESNLLPRWAARWHRFGDLSDRERFSAFYRHAVRRTYFLLMEKHTGGPIPEEVWYSSCRGYGPADVFEALLRHDLDVAPDSDLIWGDKSPRHTEHVALLGELFPEGRVIHVVRDARDCCLSLRSAWGKNMIRGAQRWADGVMKARDDGQLLGSRYLELRYEDLLADPERELRRACRFLGLEFEPAMTDLRFSTEYLGAAKGANAIVTTNVRKFERLLEPRTRRRIEAIAGAALRAFGYDVDYAGPVRRVPRPLMAYYFLMDGAHFVISQSRRSGLARTAQLQLARLGRA